MISVEKLRNATKEYLSKDHGQSDYYLTNSHLSLKKPFLFAEMEHASSMPDYPSARLVNSPKRLLVLLIGHSFDPLLQSILAYQPDKLMLIFSNFYGERPVNAQIKDPSADDKRDEFAEILKRMEDGRKKYPLPCTQGWSLDNCEREEHFTEDTGTAVFEKLRDQISKSSKYQDWEILVDITGGKKSMVAGAFLFAAYTDASIHYVDFDEYDDKGRHPYGFTCRFRKVDNLYDMFHLSAWERAGGFYQAYDFHSALAALPDDPGTPDPGRAPLETFFRNVQ